MASVMEALVKFATETRFEDLPEEVVHETKRILLDSIGCALGGLSIDKGKIAVELAKRLNGSGKATIIGVGDRVSYLGAAFANGELIQALDYDTINFPAIHAVPFVLAAPLALAEGFHASGREFIRAIAIALEISVRFGKALPKVKQIIEGKSIPQPVTGYSWNIFGGTAASGIILRLSPDKMAHALGIAGVIAPASAREKFATTVPIAMPKYLMAGWVCQAEVTSVILADMGYIGDTTVLEGEYGFWRFSGASCWEPTAITKELGRNWYFPAGTSYKIYPCCGRLSTALDCFIDIITRNNIQPEDTKKVTFYLEPSSTGLIWQNKELKTSIDAQFSAAYNLSVAAHRINVGPEWQDFGTMHNPKILEFMNKVTLKPYPYDKYATTSYARIEVVTKERAFTEEREHAKGSQIPESFRLQDNELADKFRYQASRILSSDKVDKAVDNIMNLETKQGLSELMENIAI